MASNVPSPQASEPPALAAHSLRKRFGATQALDGASFAVALGEIHALLGENGAGKSTIVRVLSGLTRPDEGSVSMAGRDVEMSRPQSAHALGIRTAFQEISLIPDLTIAQNLLLPDPPIRFGWLLDGRVASQRIEAMLEKLDLQGLDPRARVRDCPLPIRQKVEIARAIGREPKVLLLDEPTSALSSSDVEWLAHRIAGLRSSGTSIVLITHRMQEVRRFCDRLTILRNGRDVGCFEVDAVSDAEVIRLVIGRSLAATFPPRPSALPGRSGASALAARNLRVGESVADVTFSLAQGEILGVAGLQGMGQSELFYALFGMSAVDGGTIEIDGQPTVLTSPRDAIDQRIGISLVPEDRKTEGLALALTGRENISLPVIGRFNRLGLLDTRRETAAVERILARMKVHPRALYSPCAAFSGGNQQKMAIAKWLLAESRILLLFDPTRGVDVGTKHEIYTLMREFVDAGGAILLYSTDILEIANLCDRVLVMYQGRLTATLEGAGITQEAIMGAAMGQSVVAPDAAVEHA